jgi:hypothetical protein
VVYRFADDRQMAGCFWGCRCAADRYMVYRCAADRFWLRRRAAQEP